MKKRILAWALLLCMLATLLPVSAFAEGTIAEEPTDPVILSESEESPDDPVGDGVLDIPAEDPADPAGADAPDGPEAAEEPADPVILRSDSDEESQPVAEPEEEILRPAQDDTEEVPAADEADETSGLSDEPFIELQPDEVNAIGGEDLPKGTAHAVQEELRLAVTTTARIPSGGDGYAYFSFTPATTDTYTLTSCSNSDTYGYLYDADWNQLTSNDDGGDNYNFRISYSLSAGQTYYYGVRFYSSEAGSFAVLLNSPDSCGPNLTWALDDEGTLTISGTGEMTEYYSSLYTPWSGSGFSTLVLSGDVTSIGSNAFAGCSNLSTVQYDGTEAQKNDLLNNHTGTGNDPLRNAAWSCRPTVIVASGECGANGDNLTWTLDDAGTLTISGTGAMWDYDWGDAPWYSNRDSIRRVEIASGVTSIGDYAFSGCNSLTSITIPDSVTSIGGGAFSGCESLTSVTIPGSVTSIGDGAFCDCSSLTSITIPEGVTSIEYGTFGWCSSLKTVHLPASIKQIQRWLSPSYPSPFYECSSLCDVYFDGPEFLKNIRMGDGWECDGNEDLFNAAWHYTQRTSPGWNKVDGDWYYLNADGTLKTGWLKSAGSWYYLDPDSGKMATGWTKVDGKWYYFSASGVMQTGWQKIGNTWYYFEAGGAMVTGWKKLSGTWYYFKSSGAMATGLQYIGGSTYYFSAGGAMQTGWQKADGRWYYFNASGAAKKGWYQESGKWYYFLDDGAMATGWTKIGGKLYHFYASGAMNTSTGWQQIDGKWYYLDEDSVAWRGWHSEYNEDYSAEKRYYLDNDTGVMATGWKKIWGEWYYFSSSGVMQTGWVKSGGKWYYMDEYGEMVANASKNIGGKRYYFDANGVCLNP